MRRKVLWVRRTAFTISVFLLAATVPARSATPKSIIKITLTVDGEPKPCEGLSVEIRIDGHIIPTEHVNEGFVVSEKVEKLYESAQTRRKANISAHIQCSGHVFDFNGIYPAQVEKGTWALGIAYPAFWIERQQNAAALPTGRWVSFIDFDTDTCEPCIEQAVQHTTAPESAVEVLKKKQVNSWGEDAVRNAFTLAIFDIDYAKNRDYLSDLLEVCLSSPDKPAITDVCQDSNLSFFLEALYWRGDSGLLNQLLQAADSGAEAVSEIGYFYADLLESHSDETLHVLQNLPESKQEAVCKMAGKDEAAGSAKLKAVIENLLAANSDIARQCLKSLEGSMRSQNDARPYPLPSTVAGLM